MRMWMIDSGFLCRQHLLGEHGEIHKHRHNFVKQHNISGRLSPIVQIEPANMKKRHDQLVKEMIRRGYNHKSPYKQPDISYLSTEQRESKVNILNSLKDLSDRCEECKNRIEQEI